MPNAYASIAEIKGGMPDGVRAGTVKYDALLLRLASDISRAVDGWCNRVFYPELATRYLNGSGRPDLWVPDLISITSVSYSDDDGETYTVLTASDYIAAGAGGDYNSPGSYSQLLVNVNSAELSFWPCGQRSVKIVGVWGYADDRAAAWEDTGDTVRNNPLTAGGTSLTVADVAGADRWGVPGRFSPGQLLRLESEYAETTLAVDASANTVGLVRGRNGTTAASHAQSTAVEIWRAPEPIRRAVIIQANRQLERGLQGYGDTRATPEIGTVTYARQWDPEAMALMSPYRIRVHA